ncbi:MAG: hypothetical protein IJN16_01110 [Lachnospiraceae bacterium]|nr:hypothetical protein [Lachnospiraceae bacterium]
MKISRWMLIKALRTRILTALFYSFGTLPLIGAGVWFFYKVIEKGMKRRNFFRALELDENWWVLLLLGVMWLLLIWFHYLLVERGLLLDILWQPVKKLPEVSREAIQFPAKTDIYDWNYASAYWVQMRSGKEEKPLALYVSKELGGFPKGTRYNIYYLKHSKTIVKVEVLEGVKTPQPKEEIWMDPPIIPQYSKDELKKMTKMHRWRPKVLLLYCIAGAIALMVWGIYSWQNFVYWYLWERGRCVGIWITFLLLEVLFIVMFRRVDRGCFRDMHSGEICVTEVIPITDIYGKRFWNDIDRNFRDRIRGIELEVTDGTHKDERFLLYKEFSEYWNCFPMCAYLHRHFIGKRFEPGEHKLEAVRIYYLRHSGIVVKMDVKEAPR